MHLVVFIATRTSRATHMMDSAAAEEREVVIVDDWWRIKAPYKATIGKHIRKRRACRTHLVWLANCCGDRRGWNVFCSFCVLADPYLSFQSRTYYTRQQHRKAHCCLRTAGSKKHRLLIATTEQNRLACHARSVLHAGPFRAQRCNVLSSVLYILVYLCFTGMSGLSAHELVRGRKVGKFSKVRVRR